MALGKFKEALKDLRIVSKRAPSDKDAKAKLDECAKIVRRIEFEKAIEVSYFFSEVRDEIFGILTDFCTFSITTKSAVLQKVWILMQFVSCILHDRKSE